MIAFVKTGLDSLVTFGNGKSIPTELGEINAYGGNGVIRKVPKPNYPAKTIIVGRVGSQCGNVHKSQEACWVTDNALAGTPKNESDFEFLYYLLKQLRLNELRVGSGQPLVTQTILHSVSVDIPSNSKYRQKIADVLTTLDAKIELNNQINAELEGIAKLLYDYWFVQFEFPMTAAQAAALGRPALAGKPYKSSGGKLLHDQTLNRAIPEGWHASTLQYFIRNDKTGDWGQDTPTGNYTERVSCIRGTDLNALNGAGLMKPPTRYILSKNLSKLLSPGDVIIEISGGSPTQSTGRAGMITKRTLERFEHPLICSNFCKAISIKHETWLHYFMQSWKRLYDHGLLFSWEGKTSGIKNLLFDSFIEHHRVPIPTDDLLKQFDEVVAPQHAQNQKLLIQNQELTALRDWLLPMLMNGQVTVR